MITGTTANFSLGSSNDTWGMSPTPSQVNSSFSFTVSLSISTSGATLYIYEVLATVYYETLIQNSDSGTVQISAETALLSFRRSESALLSGSDVLKVRIPASDTAALSGPEALSSLSRTLKDATVLGLLEAVLTQARLGPVETSPVSALEASGLVFPSQDLDLLSGIEGVLVRALLSRSDSSPLSGSEGRNLLARLSAEELLLLEGGESPALRALFSAFDQGLLAGEGERAGMRILVSEFPPLLGYEGVRIRLSLQDLLAIPSSDLLARLIRILDPRASIELERPKATIMVLEEGRKLVERIYRGTEAAVVLRFSSSVGRYYDPLSVQLLVRKPSGSVSSRPVQRIGPGTYRAELRFDEPGIWVLRAEGIDPLRVVTEKRVEVIGDL
jgi:hypothetical protein